MIRFLKSSILLMIIVGGIWALINRDRLHDSEKLIAELHDWQTEIGKSAGALWTRVQEQAQRLGAFDDLPLADRLTLEGGDPNIGNESPVLRMACFGLDHFGADAGDLDQLWLLADICRRFDLIALQGIDRSDDRWLDMLADLLSTMDVNAEYHYITDQEIAKDLPTQNCILFNRRIVELDQLNWYTVEDPAGFFLRRPLVGCFRSRITDADRAFTFTVANVELPDDSPEQNRFRLNSLMRAVRDDGRLEDDIILMGKTGGLQIATDTGSRPSGWLRPVHTGSTDLMRRQAVDNVVFNSLATSEFTGRGGIFDFYRHYNLTLEQAQALSFRLPVWAEFSVFEAGQRRAQNDSLPQ